MNQAVEEVQGWITADDHGEITRIDLWGRMKLAYEIDKQREGYYVLYHADIAPAGIAELERNLQLAQNILRYLLIRAGE